MLEFKDIEVSFGKRAVLDSVSFSAREGRITVLLGKNGCGKSTLISCINQIQKHRGTISLDGKDLASLPPRERSRLIGIFPQILPGTRLLVSELLRLGRTPYLSASGALTEKDRESIRDAARTVGVSELFDRTCDTLSGGERQRVFLAMLLAQDTPWIVMDEPVTFLDTGARKSFYELTRGLVGNGGRSVLIVLHDISEAMMLADDVVILDSGGVAFSGTRDECLALDIIESTFDVTRHRIEEDGKEFFYFN